MNRQISDRRCGRVYSALLPVFRLVAFFAFGIKARPKRYGEPVLVLSNHTTDLDFTAVSAYISDHLYFVASKHILGMGLLGKLFKELLDPITVNKGALKPSEVMDMIRRVRGGSSILLFCEGRISHNGKTMPIAPATAKLAKKLGCRLVTFRTSGGFFKQPRWQNYLNGGKLFSSGIVNEYDPETVRQLSADELLEHIREDLYVDAYEDQRRLMQPFRLRHGIRDITRYYDTCPRCRGVDTLRAKGSRVICSCGYSMLYDKYGYLHGQPQLVSTVQDWEKLQLEVYRELFEQGRFFSDEDVQLFETGEDFRKTPLLTGRLYSSADALSIGEYRFDFSGIAKMEILRGGSALVFTVGGVHYMLQKEGACLNKYLSLRLWSLGRLGEDL